MSRDPSTDHPPIVPLARKVAFLHRADAYPEPTGSVEGIETHMAWVFLTDRRAYKLKKPIILPFLDFGSVEARRRDCEDEVVLNRRLAPEVYLGTMALTAAADGGLRLGDDGLPVDWLVEMVRLPADRMLDRALAAGTAGCGDVAGVAGVLAAFYARQPPVRLDAASHRGLFLDEAARTLEALLALGGADRAARAERVIGAQRAFVARRARLLDHRVLDGRIVEGHGDLRPEHVCLEGRSGPVIIDCLEFNRALRLVDPVDELAFLALECERLGAGWARDLLVGAYTSATGDRPPPELLDFYASFRAGLRARLAAWHMREPGRSKTPAQWRSRADAYLALADARCARLAAAVGAAVSAPEEVHE